jgi:hypothetical protein
MSGPTPSASGGPWRRWVDRMATREPGTALALFRITLAVICLHTVLDVWASGVAGWVWVGPADAGVSGVRGGHWLIQALGGVSLGTTHTLMGLAAAGSVSVLLGLGHRLGALVALQAFLALFSMNGSSGGGHDKLITNALWIVLLAPASETLSVWCRLRTGRWTSTRPVVAWPRYLLVFQIAFVYTMTGLQKLGVDWMPWGGFQAVYKSLLLPSWARGDWSAVAWVFPLTQVATVVTWWWESTWPLVLLALWFRSTRTRPGRLRALSNRLDLRTLYVVTGIAMHGTVELFLNVGPFSLISMSYYVACFHPDELSRMGRSVRGLLARPRPPRSAPEP